MPAVLLLLVVLAAAATLPSFAPGYVANWDGPGHLVRAEHFLSSLNLHDLGVFRWYPGWYLGEPMFLLYPPGFSCALPSSGSSRSGPSPCRWP